MKKPAHWSSAPLSLLTILRKGKKPARLSFKKFPDSVAYLDIVAIEKGIINQYADSYSTLIATTEDLFVVADGSRSGLVGRGIEGAVGSTLLCVTPLGIDTLYLYYFLKSKYDILNKNTTGVSIPHLNIDLFQNLELPFPSIEEQKRVALELKNQLDVFEKDFSNASVELSKLAEFRKSILNEAVTGKITKMNVDFDPKTKLPIKWKIVTIGDLSTFIGSGVTPSGGSTNYKSSGIPFIRSQNVHPNELRLDDVAYISEDMHSQMKRTHLKSKDVLLNITGASIGRSAFIPDDFGEGNVNQHVCIIRTIDDILPEYLSLFLNSPTGQDNINSLQTGVTRQGLNYDQIKAIKINLPPLEDQKEIIKYVELQDQNIHKIENQYSDQINSTTSLENAVMQMAFEGLLSTYNVGDSKVSDILTKNELLRKEKTENMAKIKLSQNEKSVVAKVKLDKKSLTQFISENYTGKTFTSQELYESLEVDNIYDQFNELFFELLQHKLNENDNEPYLEGIYDVENRRQIFKIKEL